MLGYECECGERHAERDSATPEICQECVIIRQRVACLDPDLLRLRNVDIAKELRIDELKPDRILSEENQDLSLSDLSENQSETGETVN